MARKSNNGKAVKVGGAAPGNNNIVNNNTVQSGVKATSPGPKAKGMTTPMEYEEEDTDTVPLKPLSRDTLLRTPPPSQSPRYSRPGLSSSISYSGPSTSPSDSFGRSTHSPVPGATARGSRVRSRTSTISYTPPLPPVMSRENSLEEVSEHFDQAAGPSSMPQQLKVNLVPKGGRKASKSVSNPRPLALSPPLKRTISSNASSSSTPMTAPIPSLLVSPAADAVNPRIGLKRRISTPSLGTYREEESEAGPSVIKPKEERKRKGDGSTRARSTSTSIVVPENLVERSSNTKSAIGTSPLAKNNDTPDPTPAAQWAPIFVTPASPDYPAGPPQAAPYDYRYQGPARVSRQEGGLLAAAYDFGESSIKRIGRMIKPKSKYRSSRRGSDEDSEKGLDINGEDTMADSTASNTTSRASEDSLRRYGKYWGLGRTSEGEEEEDPGYFSLPPTPPSEKTEAESGDFRAALNQPLSLPTPALSTRSLSRTDSKKRRAQILEAREGWLATVLNVWSNLGSGRRTEGKLGTVVRELGWTVGLLVGLFFVTAGMVLWMIQAMPITQLKHLPKSTTDLQLLSAEIRSYMASSEVGWWHTIGVITFVGCWKHAWSVPGAVVLNILVGSILEPMPALLLLTLITATGSLFSYLLSRPLAPLIAVLFPKPLALVRAALAPDQAPQPPTASSEMNEKVTPIQASSNPSAPPIGGEGSGSVWRRLLIMRAMGFVPWSGMNVACGVVNVDWKIFWLTTAAGSASWSYVTASVGNILKRLAIPAAALESGATGEMIDGESLTSLLRDPVLIAKLVFLSGLTLIPVVLKRRNAPATATANNNDDDLSRAGSAATPPFSPTSPTSPLTRSLAKFTPTPAAFDLLSFGRTAVRTGGRVVNGTVRNTVGTMRRFVGL